MWKKNKTLWSSPVTEKDIPVLFVVHAWSHYLLKEWSWSPVFKILATQIKFQNMVLIGVTCGTTVLLDGKMCGALVTLCTLGVQCIKNPAYYRVSLRGLCTEFLAWRCHTHNSSQNVSLRPLHWAVIMGRVSTEPGNKMPLRSIG